METQQIGKLLTLLGAIIFIIGLLLHFGKDFGILGKLPGDIHIEKENFSFYLPVTTSILISVIISLVLFIFSKFK